MPVLVLALPLEALAMVDVKLLLTSVWCLCDIIKQSIAVAAISCEWWGIVGRSPQRGPGAEPLARGSEGHSPPEDEKKLNFDNTKPL